MAVGPERIEIGMRVERAAGVCVIACAVAGELLGELPSAALVAAAPKRHFAAGVIALRASEGGRDDLPGAVAFKIKRAVIVIVR